MSAAIGIDLGTTNLKVVAVDGDGNTAASTRRRVQTHEHSGSVEQDGEAIWAAVLDAVAEVTSSMGAGAGDIGAVGVCSQYSSIVPVDGNLEPTGPMVLWRDHRGTPHASDIMARDDDAFMIFVERHGIPPIGSGLSLGHLLALQHDSPAQHEATRWYLEPMDYLVARLTGEVAATQHSMFMAQLCDNRSTGATAYDETLVDLARVDPDRLPPLVEGLEPVGSVRPELANRLGLEPGVAVMAGTNDTAAAGVAAGVARPGIAGLAIGTTSVVVDAVAEHAVDLDHEILAMPGPDLGYLVFAENGLGGHVLDHVLREFVHADDVLAPAPGRDAFAHFDAALESVEPGCGGLLFLPWLGGSLAPSASTEMRGGYVNMSLDTSRTHLVRAAAEGIAHNLAWLLRHVDAFVDQPPSELIFIGGAARSDSMCSIVASVCDRVVARVAEPEVAAARAMARRAASGAGGVRAVDPEPITVRFRPDPALRGCYDEAQQRFVRAHDAMAAILAPIDDTGDTDT